MRAGGRGRLAIALGLWLATLGSTAWAQDPPEGAREGQAGAQQTSEKKTSEKKASGGRAAKKAPCYKVIVNAENPDLDKEIAASTVAKMFIKKVKRWSHGESVTAVDLGAKSEVRKVFTRGVHGKSVTAVKSYWQRMIFSGREEQTEEMSSEKEVIAFVRAKSGAIGYVSCDAELKEGVKELKITP